jgi:hypothetical protein
MSASIRDVLPALRAALRDVGMQESPQAQESTQGFSRRHRGYRVVIQEIGNDGKLAGRSLGSFRWRLALLVSHRLRQSAGDGFADLEEAGADYEAISDALLGSAGLNALGDVQVGAFAVKVSPSGEWLEATGSFTLTAERSWPLDGGQETGS